MGFIKHYVLEESTLGLLVEENELDVEFKNETLGKRWMYFTFSGFARAIVNVMTLWIPAIILALLKLLIWSDMQKSENWIKLKAEILASQGIELNVWWFLLGGACLYFLLFLVISTVLKTFRTIISMVYYNKFLFKK